MSGLVLGILVFLHSPIDVAALVVCTTHLVSIQLTIDLFPGVQPG